MRTHLTLWALIVGVGTIAGVGAAIAGLHSSPGSASEVEICEPSNASLEPRFNIAIEAENYGMLAPCQATIIAYTPRNSVLAGIEGQLTFTESSGAVVDSTPVNIALEAGNNGMLASEMVLDPIAGSACSQLNVMLAISNCTEQAGGRASCPAIRIARADVFAVFELEGYQLSVCRAR